MIISIIAAVAKNNIIGNKGRLLWHLPEDLRRFKKLTTNHAVIMGRKTFESIGKPLPHRTNIVITRNKYFKVKECIVVHSLKDAIKVAEKRDEEEVFVIGGAQIYKQALPLANKIYLTVLDTNFEGDTHFPTLKESKWKIVRSQAGSVEKTKLKYTFVDYEKK